MCENRTKSTLCRIRDIQHRINQYECSFKGKYGLSLNEGMALCSLFPDKKMICGNLGDMLDLSPSNTSKILGHLEGKKMVKREMGESDRRQILYSLTDNGREIMTKILNSENELPDNILEIL